MNRRNERIPSPAPPASSSARGSAFRPTARSGRARCLPTASRARSSTRRLMPRSALRTPRSSTTPLAIPRASFLWTTPTTSCSESATHFTSDRCLPPGPAAVRDRRRAVGPAPPRVDPRRAARPEAASPAAGNRRPLSGPPDPQRGGDSGDRSGERRNKRALNRAPNVGRYRTPPPASSQAGRARGRPAMIRAGVTGPRSCSAPTSRGRSHRGSATSRPSRPWVAASRGPPPSAVACSSSTDRRSPGMRRHACGT